MAALIYSATMSLDGFIAGPGGDMSWLAPYAGPDPAADELAARTGALLVGNTTYGGDDPNRGTDAEGAFGGTWHGPQFVLTHHLPAAGPPDVTFTDDLGWAVAAARAAAGPKDVNVLGADVARQCLELGLLDEVVVFVVPVLLGDGVRLFDHTGGHLIRLEHVARDVGEVSTHLRMRVVRD
ncbi:dihydrofolate reductase family protein [Occultella gossypii]|uniref:Dihydrofolate reductase family protein n=1 Tax=Occultella gossypii TaxID=2800820 RepID=A0ABS7SFS4_9MICO|nr:dihydrofolate reductase family protein [Occultella gossypii]MBZ2199221.1 dihydrofolate reductase family protein [Occultella gossypii]